MHVSTSMFTAALMLAALNSGARADISINAPGTIIRGRSAVHYGDLAIDTDQGALVLLRRIEQAAKKACGGHANFSSYTGALERTFEECRSEAVQRTVKQLGVPAVTWIYSVTSLTSGNATASTRHAAQRSNY
jgi:UrcA family protein